ncbi:hypothetical protein F503_02795 [Ophiostoma piceae UAMH 11346]|uniref:DUF7924 domain-containing protein n=1 Tax=Ophiostoma piceae (strain UAMH 11346) TaxID=1262450 RepID=S3C2H8_OPHP1|nr:hypothetical protein F503_02795 [Ophiostoma piceae UAMH 11346]
MAGPRPNPPGDDNANNHDNRGTTSNRPQPAAGRPLVKTINQPEPIQTDTTQVDENEADENEAWVNWACPPKFYDRLSRIHLTHDALAELDRRNRLVVQNDSKHHRLHETASLLFRTMSNKKDLARFARYGGPDLMDVYEPSLSNGTTTTEVKPKKSAPYNANFEQHLVDHDVQATYDSQKPANLAEIRAALTQRRPSLSSSQFSDGSFDTFQDCNNRAKNEDAVMADVIPAILGKCTLYGRQTLERNLLFNNLAPLTDGTITQPRPDIYYGARPKELSRPVRDALGHYIMPSTVQDKSLAPNFFVEVKGPDGNAAVAIRQVRYDGAVGSRAMHSLQNYRGEELKYDAQAYTFSSAYHSSTGSLQLYAHHLTAPTSEGRPKYHMTQLRTFAMTDTRETFIRGATAFRNARDLSKQHRDSFIQAANEAVKGENRAPRVLKGIKESQKEEEEEEAAEGTEQRTALRNGPLLVLTPPVTSNAGSATKQAKRRHPSSSAVSPHLTRAAVKRGRHSYS